MAKQLLNKFNIKYLILDKKSISKLNDLFDIVPIFNSFDISVENLFTFPNLIYFHQIGTYFILFKKTTKNIYFLKMKIFITPF
jgi:hypothetical protein